MPLLAESLLSYSVIRDALRQAWQDSMPGATGGHEEGGFIVRDATGNASVVRWPQGTQHSILVSRHDGCRINGMNIVASFHTHPDTGSHALQGPSETDRRAVRDDPDLKNTEYIGEFVLSEETIYIITPAGQVHEIGRRQALIGQEE